MNILELKNLLQSSQKEDLEKGRLEARKIITSLTDAIIQNFKDRQEIMELIALSKRLNDPILRLEREYELLLRYSKDVEGIDQNFIQMLVWLLTAAGKEKQCGYLGRESVFIDEKLSFEQLRANLLDLTKAVATNYDLYGQHFGSTALARDLEKNSLSEIIKNIPNKENAVDLGCADGFITRLLSQSGFAYVKGYDISQDMIDVAQKNASGKETYEVADLFSQIPQKDESMDFVVANFGSASEVCDHIIAESSRILKPGGFAYLSFYNKDRFFPKWWQPWQNSLEVVLNAECDVLEVPLINDGIVKTYKIYAKAMDLSSIQDQVDQSGLKMLSTFSFPTVFSMMSPTFFNDENRIAEIIDYEKVHGKIAPYKGFYLNIFLQKI